MWFARRYMVCVVIVVPAEDLYNNIYYHYYPSFPDLALSGLALPRRTAPLYRFFFARRLWMLVIVIVCFFLTPRLWPLHIERERS